MAKKRALLVGNNYPDTSNSLRGCVNDAWMMNKLLTELFGYAQEDIIVLLNNDATAAEIKRILLWQNTVSVAGDEFFFHNSSHGAQIPCQEHDEMDGLDEIICCAGFNWKPDTFLTDDLFAQVAKDHNRESLLVYSFDNCHCGDNLRSLDVAKFIQNPNLERNPAAQVRGLTRAMAQKLRNVIALSACLSNETAADAYIKGDYHGMYTYYMDLIARMFGGNLTFGECIMRTRDEGKKNRYAQTPNIDGPADQIMTLKFQ